MAENVNDTSLNKFISQTGFCSRREADKLISQQRVTINNIVAKTGNRVRETDEVKIDNLPLRSKENPVYIAFNKPTGISSTTDLKDKHNIIEYINYPDRIFPIGRLDKASEGLIFLTNDGDIVNKILRAGNNHEKEYLVTVDKAITAGFLETMRNGVNILDTITKKCIVEQLSKFIFKIILTQGLNRQIRRMCERLNYNVTKLVRTRIMNVTLSGIDAGKWRPLTQNEIADINERVSGSVKTEEASKFK
ncbi:MAG: pseudouridine synthase [Chitinophagaceae bacterium]|nr:pseudouridine synthase [Chitinophagaceae bacterium]